MRKFVLPLAVVGAGLVAASPAAAQFYPAPQAAPYAYGNGYNNNWGQFRSLQVRIDNVQRQINRLDRRDVIRGRSADRLMDEANKIERRLHVAQLSISTFWFFLPSIPLFLVLPALLRSNVGFWPSMAICVVGTLAMYAGWFWAAPRLGIRL